MGYNIKIGELKTSSDYENDGTIEGSYACVSGDCVDVENENAPDLGHGDISGKSNSRHPSYSAWAEFCRVADITKVFYEKNSYNNWAMRGGHPGITPLTKEHLKTIRRAKKHYLLAHPNAICPTMQSCADPRSWDCGCVVDWTLGRLNWLEFWMSWALTNCKQPIIYNS